jgi:uncharacterized protein (DUF1330 family)
MAAYLIADVHVTDQRLYDEYRDRVPAVIAAYGGRYLVRGGRIEQLEGDANAQRVVVLEFSDMARLKAFYDSPEYRALIAIRQRSARANLLAVEGL